MERHLQTFHLLRLLRLLVSHLVSHQYQLAVSRLQIDHLLRLMVSQPLQQHHHQISLPLFMLLLVSLQGIRHHLLLQLLEPLLQIRHLR